MRARLTSSPIVGSVHRKTITQRMMVGVELRNRWVRTPPVARPFGALIAVTVVAGLLLAIMLLTQNSLFDIMNRLLDQLRAIKSPAEQALLAHTINGARLVVVPGAVHSPQWENTEFWLKSVRTFLSESDPP